MQISFFEIQPPHPVVVFSFTESPSRVMHQTGIGATAKILHTKENKLIIKFYCPFCGILVKFDLLNLLMNSNLLELLFPDLSGSIYIFIQSL